jgi:AcrR family transcriptional regulator
MRKKPLERKKLILKSAVQLAIKIGYSNITTPLVAKHAGVTTPLVAYYFKNTKILKREILRIAVSKKIIDILTDAVLEYDPDLISTPDF